MYADDIVIYVRAKIKAKAAVVKLSDTMVHVHKWITDSQLHLNVKKTVCMFFRKTNTVSHCEPKISVSAEVIQTVTHFKYWGIILVITLSFINQVRKAIQITKYNLANFRYIRTCLTTPVAKLYMNAMKIPHLTYDMTSWTRVNCTTLRPILSLHKQTLKVLDRKPELYHHCYIFDEYNLLSWESILKQTDGCPIVKIINGKAPPSLLYSRIIQTKRGLCRSSSFSELCFSVRASK